MNPRSTALIVFIFAASAALAGYIGIKYDEPISQQQLQPPVQSASPAPTPPSATGAQPQALQSASENKMSQEVQPPAKNTMELSSSAVVAPRTTSSREIEAPKCNKEACANAYRSFEESDCTYQPVNGPRRLCNKK